MSELRRQMDEHAAQEAERKRVVERRQAEEAERSRELSQDFIGIATQRGLGRTALYLVRSIIRPKKDTFFKPLDRSGRYATNDVRYEYEYFDSGWIILDGDESGPNNMIILPNNAVYGCSVPHPQLKVPKGIKHDPYVTTGVSEHADPVPLQAPFAISYGENARSGLSLLMRALEQ
jgi:hypothetical protein